MAGEKEETFANWIKDLINTDNCVFYYGTSNDDKQLIVDAFNCFKPNSNPNLFPDLLIDDGFIEHFEITSSKETRKGSSHQKDFHKFKMGYEKELKKLAESEGDGEIKNQFVHKGHSYENLVHSIDRNLNHHLESLQKYSGNKTKKMFLMCYSDRTIHTVCEYPDEEKIKDNPAIKELYNQERHYYDYLLSRDKDMLTKLYEYRDNIDYIIFANWVCVEIIKVSSIPDIVKKIQLKYSFHSVYFADVFYDSKISVIDN